MKQEVKSERTDNMATIRDVAKKANVGVGTVSRALNGSGYVAADKKEIIFAAAAELEYEVPKKPVKEAAFAEHIAGVIVPDVSMPFYGAFVKYVDIELANLGYKTMIYNSLGIQGRVTDAIDLAEKGILKGLIINADVTDEELKRLERLPVVSFERLLGKKIPFVSSEHKQGGRKAAEILYRNRCMNVLIITAKHLTKVYGDCRIDECRQVLKEKGVKVTVVEYPVSNVTAHVVEQVVKQYMDIYHDVDGIFSEDVAAYACLQNARRLNIEVPRDLKIVGYDGNDLSKLSQPKITTIRQDVGKIASTCITVMMERIVGNKVEKEYFVPVMVEKGGTTK